MNNLKLGPAGNISRKFITSKLTLLLIISVLVLGAYSVLNTPSEEEPQIILPVIDIYVAFPGSDANEVEKRISTPLEKILWEIDGVEYVYSTSKPGFALVTVRFYVNEDIEKSMVKVYEKIFANMDKIPNGSTQPLIKLRTIDDVPILGLTFYSQKYNHLDIRKVAYEVSDELKKIKDVSKVKIIGSEPEKLMIYIDPEKLAAYNLDPLLIMNILRQSNVHLDAGDIVQNNKEIKIYAGKFFKRKSDLENFVVAVYNNKPVYLKDIVQIRDNSEEKNNYIFYVDKNSTKFPAITVTFAKRKGTDAHKVAEKILNKLEKLRPYLIPTDIKYEITRNYGKTANDKANTLLEHLFSAVVSVIIVIWLFLGFRESIVVFISVPVTFALTLFVYYISGYTLNRVSLFALIFVTGIVIDDSIIVIENIHRYYKMKKYPPLKAALLAINEVGNPTILATLTVIVSLLPMAFVRGLMGPYMRPMPVGASVAMIFSLIVAFVATPYLAFKILKKHSLDDETFVLENTKTYKIYNKMMLPLLENKKKFINSMIALVVVLLISIGLFFIKIVKVKMLPFDNKSEFQVIVDMPEGATLETTNSLLFDISDLLMKNIKEITNIQTYTGIASPVNFNGLVRYYDLRRGNNIGDLQVNLLEKSKRDRQSHIIAKQAREIIKPLEKKYNASIKVVEIPPGPPVLSTLVAEIYGPDFNKQIKLAKKVKNIFSKTAGIVDTDWLVEDNQKKVIFEVDKVKSNLLGISSAQIANILSTSVRGNIAGLLHDNTKKEVINIVLKLAEDKKNNIIDLGNLYVISKYGKKVPLMEIVNIKKENIDKTIYHKNLKRVVYVIGDVAGKMESPIYSILDMKERINNLTEGNEKINIYWTKQPDNELKYSLKHDGEWHITYEVFRDMGISFAIVIVIMYFLLTGWFSSFIVPAIMMIPIPLTLIGVIPGHFLFNGYFTATSMIGVIALAGIMVRNSVLLIDFIEEALKKGMSLKQAVIESGAIRFRPIALTAGTVVVGAFVIIFDPIFQGLAISLMFGALVSTLLTVLVIPLIYYYVKPYLIKLEKKNNHIK